ncbi:MAG TPA: phage holin family protein [Casimicrobiaceae bacterium]
MSDSSTTPGLRDSLARLAANALSLVHTRLALAGVELAEERDRLKSQLTLLVVGAVAAGFAVLWASVYVVALFWDTHRDGALVGLTLFYVVIAVWALYRATAIRRAAPAPFSATLAELEKDRQRFVRQHVP